MNKIEAAVAPLKADAVKRAEEEANKTVAMVKVKLAEAGYDLNVCAPYPSSGMAVAKYHSALSRYKLFNSLCEWRQSSYRINEPHFADVKPERVEKFVEDAKETAAEQYDAFVAKLVAKIGEVEKADLAGNHVWGYSFLYVEKNGVKECWKTHMIINVSKLGKLFNQWPTRKIKM